MAHDAPIRKELKLLGFHLEEGFAALEIDEMHERWPHVSRLIDHYSPSKTIRAKFSEQEIEEAEYLRLLANGHHGYPQPEDDFGYKSITYDDSRYCVHCQCGLIQKAPFRLRGEPKWGKRGGFLQLNWVYDQYFVHPEVWEAYLKPFGIAVREVFSVKGAKLNTVVQIDVPQADISLCMDGQPSTMCTACGTAKFRIKAGFFPAIESNCDMPIFKTREYIGGGAASKPIIVSRAFGAAIRTTKLRGVRFEPLASRT